MRSRTRQLGFSRFACICRGAVSIPSTQTFGCSRQMRQSSCRHLLRASISTTLRFQYTSGSYPRPRNDISILSSRDKRSRQVKALQLSQFSTSSCVKSQGGSVLEDDSIKTSSKDGDLDRPHNNFENLTVEELRELLARRSQKTSGLKSELIGRLRSSAEANDLMSENLVSDPRSDKSGSGDTHTSESLDPRLEEHEGRLSSGGLSIHGVQNELNEEINSDPFISHPPESIVMSDSKTEFSGLPEIPKPSTPDSQLLSTLEIPRKAMQTPPPSSLSVQSTMEEVSEIQAPKDLYLDSIKRDLVVAGLESSLAKIEFAHIALLREITFHRTDSNDISEPESKFPTLSFEATNATEIPNRSLQLLAQRLERVEEITQLLQGQVESFHQWELSSDIALQHPQNDLTNKIRRERSMTMGNLYFARAFADGVRQGPNTTEGMRFAEFTNATIRKLQRHFISFVAKKVKKKGKTMWEKDYSKAWKASLIKFKANAGRYFLLSPQDINIGAPIQTINLKRETNVFLESQDREERHDKFDRDDEIVDLPKPKDVRTKVKVPPMGFSIYRETEVNRRFIEATKATLDRVVNPGFVTARRGQSRSEFALGLVGLLAAEPVDVEIRIGDRLRQKLLSLHPSGRVVSEFPTDANPLSQIFNPMWLRMGLMDHIGNIRNLQDNIFIVTFKSFNAAASFVGRPNDHWLEDKMSEQVYATWTATEVLRDEEARAILILPTDTLQVWRAEASRQNSPLSPYGYPIVDWQKSLWGLLRRMNLSVGADGDCCKYNLLTEYQHRVLLEMAFKDSQTLERFLDKNKEHYLTNPWKDRFFAKHMPLYGLRPEWMPVPTETEPVPNAKNVSHTHMKRIFLMYR